MGFWGLFGKDKPSEKAIAKQVACAKEQYAKPEYRQEAMDKLLSWGTKESLQGLLGRFTVVVQSPHWDEQEKRWLVDELAKRGDLAKEVLIEFVMKSHEVTHAIQALSRLCSEEETIEILNRALNARPPEDYRSSQSKMELIAALEPYDIPDLGKRLTPYLDDHNDDVKCITLDVLSAKEQKDTYLKIAQMLTQNEHSARVLRHAAGIVSRLGIDLDPHKALTAEVAEDFSVESGKLKPIRRS